VTSIRERRCLHSGPVVSQYELKEKGVRELLVIRTCAQPNWVIDDAALNLGVQGGHVLIVEGDLAAYEDVEDNAERPDVNLRACIHFGVEQLGCGKVE